ncbi:MAG: DUF2334 domain-containing protein [Terracidiphilus sp.]
MIPTQARYLLRLDDLCPTVSRVRWLPFRSLIEEFELKPILAIVPDNRDPELALSPPDPSFWDQIRSLESTGATIGMHGYRHLCTSHDRSLLGLHRSSEFAGVALATQRAWIRDGLSLLRGHGLNPRIWVAPSHGFDGNTLDALRSEGICLLSDGFARVPHIRDGITWIPQQLWGPVEKLSGTWTICLHPNTARSQEIARLRAFLRVYASQFTSVDSLLADFPPTNPTPMERLQTEVSLRRFKIAHSLRRIRRAVL